MHKPTSTTQSIIIVLDDGTVNSPNNTFTLTRGGGDGNHSPLVPDDVAFYFEMTFWVFTNALVSLAGTVANVVNIVVYVKMGLDDVVNVSLLGLAVSDLISVSSIVWMGICYGLILLDPPGILFDPVTFMYVTSGWPHFIFSRVSCYITALVSVERCLCVMLPFKVNRIVTPRRVKACLVFIFLAFPSAFIPTLMEHRMAWKYDVTHNETRYTADFTSRREEVQAKSYYAVGILFPTLSFLTVSVCVAVTNQYLLRKMAWKNENRVINTPTTVTVTATAATATTTTTSPMGNNNISNIQNASLTQIEANSTSSGQKLETEVKSSHGSRRSIIKTKVKGNPMSTKELKVIQLLTVVCVMFLVCYSPSIVLNYIRLWYPQFGVFGPYHNLAVVIYSFVFLLSVSNSSLNIVFYYVMSSKYRQTFASLFSRNKA